MAHVKAAQAPTVLVSQFGESAREKFGRNHLDRVEHGTLEKLREKRQVQSAPHLEGAAPATSNLALVPRPARRAPDCYDLWREFDSLQFANEQAEKRRQKQAQAKIHLAVLQQQIEQARGSRSAAALEKEQDRQMVRAQAEREAKEKAAETERRLEKRRLQEEASFDWLAKAEKKKDAKARRIARAKVAIDQTVALEAKLREEEMLQRQRQKQEEAELMHSQCAAFLACQEASKRREKEADLRLAEQWKIIAERPEDAELPGGMLHKIRENQKRVDVLVGTLGRAVVEKQREKEDARAMLVEKHCKAREAKEVEELLARKEDRMRKTRDMFESIKKEIDRKQTCQGSEQKALDAWQGERWRESDAAYWKAYEAKQNGRRQVRKEIDGQLFAAMVRKAKGPEPPDDELLLNRPLVEKMATNGFKTHHTVPMLQKALLLKGKQVGKS